MTKAQEIQALRGFAESLPANSYIAEWLDYIIPSVERDIASDIIPDDGTSIRVMVEQQMEQARAAMKKEREAHEKWVADKDREVAQRERFIDEAARNLRFALKTIER